MGQALADRHPAWAERTPRDVADLWGFIVDLESASFRLLLIRLVASSCLRVSEAQYAHLDIPWVVGLLHDGRREPLS